MIGVEVQIAAGMDESARFQIANLGHHDRQQGIGSDIEGHTQEQIGAALVKLAAQLPVLDKELKQRVTGRQGHLIQLADIPGADN